MEKETSRVEEAKAEKLVSGDHVSPVLLGSSRKALDNKRLALPSTL